MINQLIFITNSLFHSVTYDKHTDNWCFSFYDKIYASTSGFWRLLEKNKILFVSLDNGHQFGLSKPLDLVDAITKQLTAKRSRLKILVT